MSVDITNQDSEAAQNSVKHFLNLDMTHRFGSNIEYDADNVIEALGFSRERAHAILTGLSYIFDSNELLLDNQQVLSIVEVALAELEDMEAIMSSYSDFRTAKRNAKIEGGAE